MAQTGKENLPRTPRFLGIDAELEQNESILLTANALSSSKIPVLSKSRLPPEVKQSQQQNRLQQICPSSLKSKRVKTPKKPCTISDPGVAATGLLPKSCSRNPLGEMQLSTSGHRNVSKDLVSDRVTTVEFLPDADALASILSNMGLTNQMVGATHKPSLARRVPLRGSRTCSVSNGAGQGSLYKDAPAMNLARMSHVSRVTPEDMGPSQSCSLTLTGQQLKALSVTLENFGPGVAAKPNPSMENLGVGKCQDSGARSKAECPSSITEAGIAVPSNSAGKKESTGTSWQDEEFVPDPAAKASILSNMGLSHSALQANGKLSLAQRVPVKDTRKRLAACSSTRDGNAALLEPRMSAPPTAKFGRISCRSTQGLKGLKESEASEAQPVNTPSKRCSVLDFSPYGLARRIPCPQSLHSNPWKCNRVPLSACVKGKRAGAQFQTETPQAKWAGGLSPQTTCTVDSKQDGTAVPWEKIAVRLFHDDLGTTARKASPASEITQEMRKLQRIELLAQLLRQEITGGVDCEVTTPLEELHKLLSAHCSPAPKPVQSTTPQPDSSPNLCKPAPESPFAAAPELSTALAASSQQMVCPSPSVHSVQSPSPRASSTGDSAALPPLSQVRQRLDDLLQAPNRFHEACLNDECAFYTTRVTSVPQASLPRCKEPVAKMLDADDTMHFIPISLTMPTFAEAERSSPA
ncbi:tastin [Tiliqua scincoides]|uniref:tastin n=1 Tax=Tiliqua scincoides TaxID=71010 RepID=UPI003461D26A